MHNHQENVTVCLKREKECSNGRLYCSFLLFPRHRKREIQYITSQPHLSKNVSLRVWQAKISSLHFYCPLIYSFPFSFFLSFYLFICFCTFQFSHHTVTEKSEEKKIKNKKANTTNSYSHIARWAFYLPLAICFFCLLSQSHTHKNKHRQNTLHTLSLSVGWFFQSLPFKNSRDWCLR